MEMKERIINGAMELFMRYGIKSITMDDLASYLGVSKKTIYQYVKDKNDLVSLITKKHLTEDTELTEKFVTESKDAVDEMIKISNHLRSNSSKINPAVVFDMRKFFPNAWKIFLDYKNNCVGKVVISNLERGIREGYYRSDINVSILSALKQLEIEMGFDPAFFPLDQVNPYDVQMELFEHFLYGILTKEGLDKYNEYKQNNHE